MNTRNVFRLFFVIVLLTSLAGAGLAQSSRRASTPKSQPTLLSALPTSDTVAHIRLKRVLDEALPKLMSDNPARLAEINSQIDQFKTRTGIDPRAFTELAMGLRYTYPSPGITKITTVALAQGNFNANAIVAAGKVAASGKYREEKYQGRSIYIFTIDQEIRVLGLLNLRIRELAVTPLTASTLALGDRASVRGAIDASKGNRRMNAELIALATQDPSAIVGFGGNISPALLQNLRIGNDTIANDLASVRQVYGSIGMTEKNVELFAAARTANPGSARSLGDTVEGLKAFGALFTNRLPAAKGILARSALSNLKVTIQGNDLQIRTAVAQAEVAPLMRGF
ncbi:MAG: hypothetical protein ABJB97_08365 [Acidobacteriota bacterium]